MQWRRFNIIQEAIDDLRERGYVNNFALEGEDTMTCAETGDLFQPDDLNMMENHHFPIPDSEDEQTLIYALKSKRGLKGLVITTFSSYPDIELLNFLEKVKIQPPQNEQVPEEAREEKASPRMDSTTRNRFHMRRQKTEGNQRLPDKVRREGV